MQRSARPCRLAFALAALAALASCSDSDPPGSGGGPGGGFRLEEGESLGEGIFAIDLGDRSIVQLAAIPGPDDTLNFTKFTFADNGDGSFDFAYVPEIEDGGLHHFEAFVGRRGITSSEPELKLQRSATSGPNGPAYCTARGELGFGVIEDTFVGLELIGAADFRALDTTTIEGARAAGKLTTVQSDDLQISTDLACGNLASGLVYDHLDCHDSASVNDCLSGGTGNAISEIRYKGSAADPEIALTFPNEDAKIVSSPRRPPLSTLGDNGPTLHVGRDASIHLAFERLYTTPELFEDPDIADEFRSGGFNALYYKHITGDPRAATEYEIDFASWLATQGVHGSIISSDIFIDRARPDVVELVAAADFKAPGAQRFDQDVYVGILRARFDADPLPANPDRRIVLDASDVEGIVTFAQFTCRLWDAYGIAPTGKVYVYATLYPRWLRTGDRELVVFSTVKGLYGTLQDGIVTSPNGVAQPVEDVRQAICGALS